MAEYIERRAVLALTDDYELTLPDDEIFFEYIDPKKVAAIPAADVRPVVLCRDCKYYFKDEEDYEMCENSEGYDQVTEDDFCSRGRKREES